MGIPKIILDKMGKLSKIYTPFGENGNPILSRGPCRSVDSLTIDLLLLITSTDATVLFSNWYRSSPVVILPVPCLDARSLFNAF